MAITKSDLKVRRSAAARARRLTDGGRSPAAWSSASLYLVACGLLLGGAVTVPMNDDIAHPVDGSLAGVCALVAAVSWFAGRHLGRRLPHVAVLLGIVVITVAIAASRTFGGEIFPAFGYLWTTVYLAYFLARRTMVVYVSLIAASFGVALAVSQVTAAFEAWVVVVASVVALAMVFRLLVELLARQAEEDPLTGLLNRKGLERSAVALRSGSTRRGSKVTLVAIDLDGFKAVNDRVGHVAADGLLVELAGHWRDRLRGGDLLGRIGGDEFLLLLQDTAPERAGEALDGLRIGSPLAWSAGTTELRADETLEAALARADKKLYEAKSRRPAVDQ